MRRIGIVGAGQSGLQLGLGLLHHGYAVTLLSDRSGEEIRAGRVTSSQCMFDSALRHERDLGICFWDGVAPDVVGIEFTAATPDATKALSWCGFFDAPAHSVDQRVKMPHWLDEFSRRGGDLQIVNAGISDLESLAKRCDLVLVAVGKGELGDLFARDEKRSAFDRPMRALALTYVNGRKFGGNAGVVSFNAIPGVGEYFCVSALTTTGPCDIMIFEGVPGGPMDVWERVTSPSQHLETSLALLREHLPWEYERTRDCTLTDDFGILSGRFTPTIRRPVATLPSGARVLGVADAVCLNDPITGQGSNNASKCAAIYMASILEREEKAFDVGWMESTFERYWSYARFVTDWTNGMLLPPPPHVQRLLAEGDHSERIRHWFANGFDDPRRFYPMIVDPEAADRFLAATE